MKTVQLTGIEQFEIKEVDPPRIARSEDVLLRIAAVGICGSDIHYYKHGRIGDQVIKYPFIIGHECSAIVEAVGDGVQRCKPGDHVFVEPAVSCGECDQCRRERFHTCRHLRFLGCPGQLSGALSQYIVMPQENCYALPSDLTLEMAVLAEPLSIALHAVRQAGSLEKKSIAILGAGPIGLSVLLVSSQLTGQDILVSEKILYRLQAAAAHGADATFNPLHVDVVSEVLQSHPSGLDVVFECCGDQSALDQAIDMLAPGGILVLVGIPEMDRISFDVSKIRRKEITIVNVRRQNQCVASALNLLLKYGREMNWMITHRFRPEDAGFAFTLVDQYRDGVIKAIIKWMDDV